MWAATMGCVLKTNYCPSWSSPVNRQCEFHCLPTSVVAPERENNQPFGKYFSLPARKRYPDWWQVYHQVGIRRIVNTIHPKGKVSVQSILWNSQRNLICPPLPPFQPSHLSVLTCRKNKIKKIDHGLNDCKTSYTVRLLIWGVSTDLSFDPRVLAEPSSAVHTRMGWV